MKKLLLLTLFLPTLLFSACTPVAPAEPTPAKLTPVRLPVGYIPNVQFAPLYVAIEKGFYREAGLDVTIDYSMENDNTVLTATDELQFAVVSGEQVLLARAQQMPVVYVMAWYQQYPVGIVAKASSGINSLADLRGRKLGLPGLYGASYIGAVAMLDSAGLTESDLTLDSIGYNQVEVLMTDKDDAVVIYTANEPNQLRALGAEIVEFKAADTMELVANGIITNEKTLQENPALVSALVNATLKGIDYTLQHPEEAFEISKKYVENLAQADQEVQMQVLLSSAELWRAERLGYSDPVGWENMQRVLLQMGLLKSELDLNAAFDNRFIP
jgi:NitT/TauT family transport system substrate-binding protein